VCRTLSLKPSNLAYVQIPCVCSRWAAGNPLELSLRAQATKEFGTATVLYRVRMLISPLHRDAKECQPESKRCGELWWRTLCNGEHFAPGMFPGHNFGCNFGLGATSGSSPNWLTTPMTLRRCTPIAPITPRRYTLITPMRFAYGRCTTTRDARL
jgi:hypothetical protein